MSKSMQALLENPKPFDPLIVCFISVFERFVSPGAWDEEEYLDKCNEFRGEELKRNSFVFCLVFSSTLIIMLPVT